MTEYESIIGLEVHIQLKTITKLFCGCPTAYGDTPNSRVCPVCLGMPGALPVLNRQAVEFAMRLVAAVNASLNQVSSFARKNYFYPDLPKGYQISQFERPLAHGGSVNITTATGETKAIGISEIHIEEEAGKSFHDIDDKNSYIDFNRAGVPLIEVVTGPDLSNSREAYEFLHELKQIATYIDITTGNMQEGALRWDVNVSVRRVGDNDLYPRHEIKNMNSFRFAAKAIDYEIEKQVADMKIGQKATRQTMLWNESENKTEPMREKEGAADYRYFPEPDLRPLVIEYDWFDKVKNELPELPTDKRKRFKKQYGLRNDQAEDLTVNKSLANYYEAVVKITDQPQKVANWLINEFPHNRKEDNSELYRVSPKRLAGLLLSLFRQEVSSTIAREVYDLMSESGKSADEIIGEENLSQISDKAEIDAIIEKVLFNNQDNVKMYFSGKSGIFGYFVGQVMKATGNKANPRVVNELLIEALNRLKADDT